MFILAGLGNPGSAYEKHRHNVGFMLLERIAERHEFTPFKTKNKAATAEGKLGAHKIVLLKPLSFMNESGLPIKAMLDFYKLDSEALTVAHDDIDLEAGKVRVKIGGGHGGHNGLRSIDKHIGTEYRRLRIGVGRSPFAEAGDKMVDRHVLSDFTSAERDDWLDALLENMAENITLLYDSDEAVFMNEITKGKNNGV